MNWATRSNCSANIKPMNIVASYTVISAIGASLILISAKVGLEAFGPFTMVFFRFAISVGILWFLVPDGRKGLSTGKKLFVTSVLGALNPILLFIALQFTDANIAPIIYAVIPIMAAIYLFFFEDEKLSRKQIGGLTIGLVGVLWIATLPLLEEKPDFSGFWANSMILVAAVSAMLFGVKSRSLPAATKSSPETIIYHFSLLALIVSIPFAIFESTVQNVNDFSNLEVRHIIAAVAVGLTSLMAYVPQWYALKLVSTTLAFMTSYLQPIITAVLAVIILSEPITIPIVAGGLMTLLGAWWVQSGHRPN